MTFIFVISAAISNFFFLNIIREILLNIALKIPLSIISKIVVILIFINFVILNEIIVYDNCSKIKIVIEKFFEF